jgi:pilus assembly protein CpaB
MRATVVTFIAATILGVVVAAGVFVYTSGAENRALADQQAVEVVVSTEEILPGTTLAQAWESGALESTQVPRANAPAAYLSSTADPNAIAQFDIPAGQIVLESAFGAELPVAETIDLRQGQVALTVELGDPQRVGTFLRPGSSIAIFNTATDVIGENRTRLLLSGVQVLAVGDATVTQSEDAQVEGAQTALVTVALSASEAEKLVHATQTGAIYLALLGGDAPALTTAGVSDSTLYETVLP